jgi:hypothetical protein
VILPLSLEQESFVGPDPVTAPNAAFTHRISGPLRIEVLQAAAALPSQPRKRWRGRCDAPDAP